jgi:hypothetical protein
VSLGRIGIVARGDGAQPQAEIERPPPGRDAKGNIGRVRPLEGRRAEPAADPMQRRARRQGLALMIASSIVSLLILYGAWVALRG